jgi:hypothetical protein
LLIPICSAINIKREGKILICLGQYQSILKSQQSTILVENAGTSVIICWRKRVGFSKLAEWDRFIAWTNLEINQLIFSRHQVSIVTPKIIQLRQRVSQKLSQPCFDNRFWKAKSILL